MIVKSYIDFDDWFAELQETAKKYGCHVERKPVSYWRAFYDAKRCPDYAIVASLRHE